MPLLCEMGVKRPRLCERIRDFVPLSHVWSLFSGLALGILERLQIPKNPEILPPLLEIQCFCDREPGQKFPIGNCSISARWARESPNPEPGAPFLAERGPKNGPSYPSLDRPLLAARASVVLWAFVYVL